MVRIREVIKVLQLGEGRDTSEMMYLHERGGSGRGGTKEAGTGTGEGREWLRIVGNDNGVEEQEANVSACPKLVLS
jgi:hypothetical protein